MRRVDCCEKCSRNIPFTWTLFRYGCTQRSSVRNKETFGQSVILYLWDTGETGDLTVIVGSRTHFVKVKEKKKKIIINTTAFIRLYHSEKTGYHDRTKKEMTLWNVNAVVFERSREDLWEVLLHYLANIYKRKYARYVKWNSLKYCFQYDY